MYLKVELLGHEAVSFKIFFEETPSCLPQWLHQSVFPPTVHKGSLFSTSRPTRFIDESHSERYEVITRRAFNFNFSDD